MKWTRDYERFAHRRPGELHAGLDGFVHSMIGMWRRRPGVRWQLRRTVAKALAQESEWAAMPQKELQTRLAELRICFRKGGSIPAEKVSEALVAVREAADRQIGLRAFPVQLMGALALHRGHLVEMATGEGKTLVAGLAAVLAGWSGKPCHIVTVNDYLVRRDAEWLEPFYRLCGVSVGTVTADLATEERRQAYDRDITYATSKELLGDFLRDQLRSMRIEQPTRRLIRQLLPGKGGLREQVVMRGLHTAVVDEADSVLIDEAVTPLIISAPKKNPALNEVVMAAGAVVTDFTPGTDYRVNERFREIELTGMGRDKLAQKSRQLPGIWQGVQRREEVVKQALSAREFFRSGKQYVVNRDRVIIVDEFTGRAMPGRTWSQGVHQAIEAKEGVSLTDANETVARMSFQRFFRQYHRLSGMTGTGRESAREFWHVYELPLVQIPPNKPCRRRMESERFFATAEEKWTAIQGTIRRAHEDSQPILVGTRSVDASDRLARELTAAGLNCQLLNAVNDAHEAAIIQEAGQPGKITVATNMAGRGTDIKLPPEVIAQGLFVIATERHESGRVDRQLIGRSGRQGDPGRAQIYVSAEDELLRKYLPPVLVRAAAKGLKLGIPGGQIPMKGIVWLAQFIAQKQAAKARGKVVESDKWLDRALAFAGR
jgi:preprotein translocase subunit SecA